MEGRAALVTGGSSGIGLAVARALGQDGYSLTVSARRPEKLEPAAEELRKTGASVEAIAANMAHEDARGRRKRSHQFIAKRRRQPDWRRNEVEPCSAANAMAQPRRTFA